MIQSGAYSAKYQRLVHEQFFAFREQNDKQTKKAKSKERNLSKETRRRQRALEDRKRQMAEEEEERRQAVLKERRREQDRARASFRQAVQPRAKAVTAVPDRRQVVSRVGRGAPTTLDVKEIAGMVSGNRQVSVPSLDEMLAQLRDDSPVSTHEPPWVGRTEKPYSAAGSRVQGSSLHPASPPDSIPEIHPDTSVRPESPGSIYLRKNYASVVQDSLEVEEGGAHSLPHTLSSSQWADKVCLHDSLEDSQGSSSGLHLSEPVLGISRELERVVSSRPCTQSEADLLAHLSSAASPLLPSSGARQPTSILKKSGQKAVLKQILSNAVEASSPPASLLVVDSKHVRFADDPTPVIESDSEISSLAANFHAKASNGSSAHFLFSRGSEFAFRPLKNGLVLQAGETPLQESGPQPGGATLSSDPPNSPTASTGASLLTPPSHPPSQSSLAKEHPSDVCQAEEGGIALNQTPTDDQISKLWSQMRGYLEENKALQETQRAGLQRLKRSTQLGWQRRQTDIPALRKNSDHTKTVPGSLRDDGESHSHAPLKGVPHQLQERRGSGKGARRTHTAAEHEGGRCSPQAAYSQQEPTESTVPSKDRRDTNKLTLRHQEQRLMESIERLNTQLKLKLPVQTGVHQSRPPLPLAPPTSSIPSIHSQRLTRPHSGNVPSIQQKRALKDLPNRRTRQNPQAIARAADQRAQTMNSRTELSRAFHRQQYFH